MKTWLFLIAGVLVTVAASEDAMRKCVRLAMPLLSENHLVVPSTREELQMVCNKWHEFVECINNYVARRYSDAQKSAFNQDVETAVRNVYKMCRDPMYSEEYLKHAPCIKQMTTEKGRCGTYYSNMASAVTEGIGSDQNICCLHHKFRTCMSQQRPCENSQADPAVVQGFVNTFLDNGLNVFVQKCNVTMQYVFNSQHCAGARQTRLDDERDDRSRFDDRYRPGRPRPDYERHDERPDHQRPDHQRPDHQRPDHERRGEQNHFDEPDQLRPEHRAAADQEPERRRPTTTARPQRGTTTPYRGWLGADTTTPVWLISNDIDDRAQARRQESAAAAASAGLLALAAGLAATLATR